MSPEKHAVAAWFRSRHIFSAPKSWSSTAGGRLVPKNVIAFGTSTVTLLSQCIISMSDYACFVAAATRDMAMTDLLEENKKLREQVEACKSVTITGKGGSPIYAQGSLDTTEIEEVEYENCLMKIVELRNSTGENADSNLAMCKILDMESAEIRVGGVLLYIVRRNSDWNCVSLESDLCVRLIYHFHGATRGVVDESELAYTAQLCVEYGPLPDDFDPDDAVEFGPHLHTNDEIPEVRFLDIGFAELKQK